MRKLNLFTRRRSRRGTLLPYVVSLLLTGGTGFYLWSGRENVELPFLAHLRSGAAAVAPPGSWEVYFSPGGGATDAIVREIGAARERIRVQAYTFTSAPIARALAAAKKRGVEVEVILDKSQQGDRYTSATYLAHQNVPVRIDSEHAIAHNKVMIVDGKTVITGSFNFTKAAESRNSENVLILRAAGELAAKYEANWSRHAAHSRPYVPPRAERVKNSR